MINTKYVGSKNRISKYIAPLIQKCIDDNGITEYYETCVGGANMIDKIHCDRRVGIDIHKELIALLNALSNGYELPEHITEEEYNNVRLHKDDYPDYYVGLVGFNSTFGAKYFGGYARAVKSDGITPRDESNEAYRNIMKQLPKIKGIEFYCTDYSKYNYDTVKVPSVIYCDIPYKNTTKYSTNGFDYDKFWQWVRDMSKSHYILVSEYNAPDDFDCVWKKEHLANFDCNRNDDKASKKRTEKLFTYRGGLYDKYRQN